MERAELAWLSPSAGTTAYSSCPRRYKVSVLSIWLSPASNMFNFYLFWLFIISSELATWPFFFPSSGLKAGILLITRIVPGRSIRVEIPFSQMRKLSFSNLFKSLNSRSSSRATSKCSVFLCTLNKLLSSSWNSSSFIWFRPRVGRRPKAVYEVDTPSSPSKFYFSAYLTVGSLPADSVEWPAAWKSDLRACLRNPLCEWLAFCDDLRSLPKPLVADWFMIGLSALGTGLFFTFVSSPYSLT